jgi:hypothetical protein
MTKSPKLFGTVLFLLGVLVLCHGCAGMGCLSPFTKLTDCGGKHGIWP